MNRVHTGLLAFLIMGTLAACGGGGDGGGEVGPTATATAILNAEVIDMAAANAGLDPQTFQLQLDTTYVIRFTNESAANTYRLVAERYDIDLPVAPDDTVVSDPFTESEAGEYPCFDLFRRIVPDFQCTLVFS